MNEDGYKKTVIGLIPLDWEVHDLDYLCPIITDGSHSSPTPIDMSEYYIATVMHMKGTQFDLSTLTPINHSDFLKLEKNGCRPLDGDVLLSKDGTIGKVQLFNQNNENIVLLSSVAIIRTNRKFLESQYLAQVLKMDSTLRRLVGMKKGSAIRRIILRDIKRLAIPVASLPEQQRISEILSTTDAHIERLDILIEDYQLLKKGMIKKLLTEGIGHTEFKETEIGTVPKAWDVVRLNDISLNKGEYGIGAKAIDYIENKPRYLRITDIDENGRLIKNCEYKTIEETEYSSYVLKCADLVFARTGNTTGKTYLYNPNDGDLVCAGFLIKFSIDNSRANPEFIRQNCFAKRYWDWVKKASTRSGQPGINSKQYGELKFPLPSLNEQNQIAEILKNIDDRLLLIEIERQNFTELKKGLMEKLLTGKIRTTELKCMEG